MHTITYVSPADLTPYARNSRTHSPAQVKQIVASIREFGFVNPVLIDADRRIIAGHGRVLAAKELGLPTVPCLEVTGLSEDQLRAYIIADNKLAENAGWDEDLLRLELADLALNLDLDFLGFDQALFGDEEKSRQKLSPVSLDAPRMSWVLIGIPLVRFGEIQEHIDNIAAIPDTKATAKKAVAAVTAKVASLQAEQKALLPAMRQSNANHLVARKSAKAAEREADAAAIASGEFWNATPAAIKAYFHPPFDKNHLADVSAHWRAALFLECKSTGWKDANGNYRHKLVGTGRAYLCGIDDNGDEWGHDITISLDYDQHGNQILEATVEQAMSGVFDVSLKQLANCTRQGDLLFRPCSIRTTTEVVCASCGRKESEHIRHNMFADLGQDYTEKFCWYVGGPTYNERVLTPPHLKAESSWTVRETHTIKAASLRHNGIYFSADEEITIEHTSHQPVVLQAGEYCLHTLQIADAD